MKQLIIFIIILVIGSINVNANLVIIIDNSLNKTMIDEVMSEINPTLFEKVRAIEFETYDMQRIQGIYTYKWNKYNNPTYNKITIYHKAYSSKENFKKVLLHELGHHDEVYNKKRLNISEKYADEFMNRWMHEKTYN